IILSTPFAVICYFLIWFVPDVSSGQLVWYLTFYCLFQTLVTCFHVPYSALTMFISKEQSDRDSATGYRMTVEVLGTVLGTAIQGQIVGTADTCVPNSLQSSLVNTSVASVEESKVSEDPGSLTNTLLEGNFALFLKYTLQRRKDYQNILLVIMISATLTVPFWQWFLTRFGKKTAVYIGISSVIPFMIVAGLVKINVIVTYIVAVAAGLSVAAAFLLPWSMLPDVIDDFILNNPESPGHEAIFFSFYVFFTKFASGVSLGISTLSLDYAGYQALSCSQPEAVNLTLRLLVCAAPIILILIGLFLFKLYPINEEKRKENRKALQLLRENDRDSDSDSVELASNL
ncbi:hypothetical protein AB205_0044730, partial [Aquarana catesbeiana]